MCQTLQTTKRKIIFNLIMIKHIEGILFLTSLSYFLIQALIGLHVHNLI